MTMKSKLLSNGKLFLKFFYLETLYCSLNHKLTYNQIPSHTHKYGATPKQMGHCNSAKKKWDNRHGRNNMNGTWTSGEKGSDTKHNNMPPYVKLNYIIKQPSKNAN